MLGGKIVYGSDEFSKLAPDLTAPMPDWSPVKYFGGYQHGNELTRFETAALKSTCCLVHHQPKTMRHTVEEVINDWRLGCNCWAF